jgi:prophage regulatory protein|tara:strand:+ start:1584 stop:1811 length:228 start_codon:yes stop_codon:yes gene_type:complete
MDQIQEITPHLLRLKHIIGDNKANPPILPIFPISKSSWWDGVKKGKYPKPIKISGNITVWKSDEIQNLINNICNQ